MSDWAETRTRGPKRHGAIGVAIAMSGVMSCAIPVSWSLGLEWGVVWLVVCCLLCAVIVAGLARLVDQRWAELIAEREQAERRGHA